MRLCAAHFIQLDRYVGRFLTISFTLIHQFGFGSLKLLIIHAYDPSQQFVGWVGETLNQDLAAQNMRNNKKQSHISFFCVFFFLTNCVLIFYLSGGLAL